MTMLPPAPLRLTTVDTEDTVRVELDGDLDYDTADSLLTAVTATLAARPRPSDLHLHCAGLRAVDSMGLSILLMIRRRVDQAGVRLHLDDRPAALERLLTITGSLDYLTKSPTDTANPSLGQGEDPRTSGEAVTARPTGPDSTT
ncbi:STAS domain-containing protein [Streptomyces ortus]|uniref:Anti-sigma factor antagonist n=1 Tax=Streptomyces ortus TaxID=2867268 RepID=A0ABT3VJQ3_9ACTN|nr:STAS domain-containing protein [Streptomyces ortus]MCX4238543.1 STAS domain-containing protein [Streptomyces ortus]